jgi:hypothetical protein
MPGGLIQLTSYGAQDLYLTGNPQISFFKKVYRRYTNFSMEMINILPSQETKKLQDNNDNEIVFNIKRHADLVKDIYLVFTLPDIYSSSARSFQWIDRLGEYLIKEVSINIGSRKIDTQYSEWLHIWQELNLLGSHLHGYKRLIGYDTENTDPSNVIGNSGTYPASSPGDLIPSIRGRKCYVPLQFWFNKKYSSAFPLIAMQYDDEITIKITLRPYYHLYTILNGSSVRTRPTSSMGELGGFLNNNIAPMGIVTEMDISPSVEVNYLFLDTDERKRFAINEHEYIIQQVQRISDTVTPSTTNDNTISISLKTLQHPVSQLFWILRRTDMEEANQWFNFTNWPDQTKPPYFNTASYNPFGTEATLSHAENDLNNYTSLKNKDLVLEAKLMLGNVDRFETKETVVFNIINNYQHNINIPSQGINSYSFSLNNYIEQPTGTCNFSRFSKADLQLKINRKPGNGSHSYNIYVFALNYNVFRLIGGLGDVEFST